MTTNTKTDLTVAHTILNQLGGVAALQAMTGAHSFLCDVNSILFQWKARSNKGMNRAMITLLPSDSYKVQFFKGKGINCTEVVAHTDVDCSVLKSLFSRETGLELTVPTVLGL